MKKTEFLSLLDELFELPGGTLKGSEELESLEGWNSLGMMSFIAIVDEHRGITVPARQLVKCKTVGDLLAIAEVTG